MLTMKSQKRQRNHNFITIRSENPKVLPLPGAGERFSPSCHIEAGREAVCLILARDKQSREDDPQEAGSETRGEPAGSLPHRASRITLCCPQSHWHSPEP